MRELPQSHFVNDSHINTVRGSIAIWGGWLEWFQGDPEPGSARSEVRSLLAGFALGKWRCR